MSNWLLDGLKEFFGPNVPRWACELTPDRVIVVETGPDRRSIRSQAVLELPSRALTGDLREADHGDSDSVKEVVRQALDQAAFSGSEIAVVVPDGVARVTILNVEKFPTEPGQQEPFIRWKLKKNMPFDTETAQLTYKKLGQNGSVDILVALSPRGVTRQYEDLLKSIGLHAGIVIPSTIAALNLLVTEPTDTLFLKASPEAIATCVFMDGQLRFYRRVVSQSLYDAVHPTIMYYEDKLGGSGIRELITCVHDSATGEQAADLAIRLEIPERSLYLAELGDVFKPALGALQL